MVFQDLNGTAVHYRGQFSFTQANSASPVGNGSHSPSHSSIADAGGEFIGWLEEFGGVTVAGGEGQGAETLQDRERDLGDLGQARHKPSMVVPPDQKPSALRMSH